MRMSLAFLMVALLTACSSGGGNRILAAAMDQLFGAQDGDGTGVAAPALTREAVEASGAATIRVRLLEDPARSTLLAASDNGGYVTYLNRSQQSVTLRGGLITASRGLGHDLLAVEADPNDPLITPTAFTDWPEQIARTYIFPSEGPGGARVSVLCRYEALEPREIEILGVTHRGLQVRETCRGDAEFENLLFTGSRTGRIWRSLQWLGPDQGLIDLEIVEPYTPG